MALIIDFDVEELEKMASHLEADQKMMESAARAAAIRTARWARVQVSRGMGSRLGVPSEVFKKKRRTKLRKRSLGANLWIGLNPLNAKYGNPRRSGSGLKSGKQTFQGAFVMVNPKGGRAVVKRRGRARLPVDAVNFDVPGQGDELVNGSVWPEMNKRFMEYFQEEIEKRVARREASE